MIIDKIALERLEGKYPLVKSHIEDLKFKKYVRAFITPEFYGYNREEVKDNLLTLGYRVVDEPQYLIIYW